MVPTSWSSPTTIWLGVSLPVSNFSKRASFAIIIWKLNIIDPYPRLQGGVSAALLPLIPATWQKNLIQNSQHDEHKVILQWVAVHAIICTLFRIFSLTRIYLILDYIKYWHDTVHLGLLAFAQASFVRETELSEYYLILKGYCNGFVHVCLREGTNRRCKSAKSIGGFTFMGLG